MTIDSTLNGEPVLSASLHFPLSGAWSGEVQVSADDAPAVGASATLSFAGTDFLCWVVRSGIEASRAHVRITGGAIDWTAVQPVKHYRNTDAGQVLSDVGITPSAAVTDALAFWTRNPGTTGSAVQSLAAKLGVNWRVLPDGTVRIAAEDTPEVESPDAVETGRDPGRGIVSLAVEDAVIQPGVRFGDDSVGDVSYDLGETLRVRYYTEARANIRNGLERIIRWVTRDTMFLGQYTAEVSAQNADGTLDLLPDDLRLRAEGLQSVPIRHGLPGVTVEVPAGERVLLGFDGGDPTAPYAALWHEGQVTSVSIGGSVYVAMSDLVDARIASIQSAFDSHIHPTSMGPTSPPTSPIGSLATTASTVLKSSS